MGEYFDILSAGHGTQRSLLIIFAESGKIVINFIILSPKIIYTLVITISPPDTSCKTIKNEPLSKLRDIR